MNRNRGMWVDGTPKATDGLPLVSDLDTAPRLHPGVWVVILALVIFGLAVI